MEETAKVTRLKKKRFLAKMKHMREAKLRRMSAENSSQSYPAISEQVPHAFFWSQDLQSVSLTSNGNPTDE